MDYYEMISAIEDAIFASQVNISGEQNSTGVAICVRPETTNAAKALGLTVGKCASHTGGDCTVDKYVGRGCVPLQELALALVNQVAKKSGGAALATEFKNVTQEDIAESGMAEIVTIRFRPPGSSTNMAWVTVYIAACDIAPSRMFVRESISVGVQALKSYIDESAGKRKLSI